LTVEHKEGEDKENTVILPRHGGKLLPDAWGEGSPRKKKEKVVSHGPQRGDAEKNAEVGRDFPPKEGESRTCSRKRNSCYSRWNDLEKEAREKRRRTLVERGKKKGDRCPAKSFAALQRLWRFEVTKKKKKAGEGESRPSHKNASTIHGAAIVRVVHHPRKKRLGGKKERGPGRRPKKGKAYWAS